MQTKRYRDQNMKSEKHSKHKGKTRTDFIIFLNKDAFMVSEFIGAGRVLHHML